jgi:hypothetical protein
MSIEVSTVSNLHQLTAVFHCAIPGQLRLRHRPGLFGRVPALKTTVRRDVSRDLRGHTQTNATAPHFRERHRSFAAIGFVGECGLSRANLFDRTGEIAIPFNRVHG